MLQVILNPLIYIATFLVIITVVIAVHELGHFWAARLFRVKIDRFSLGFGKTLWARTDKSGVEWRIASLPLGGYVKFSGDADVSGVPDAEDLADLKQQIIEAHGPGSERNYYHFKPVWQRAIIAAAGPFANFVLAVAIFFGLNWGLGREAMLLRVNDVTVGSPAAQAGLQRGDIVLSANGRAMQSYPELGQYIQFHTGEPVVFRIQRGRNAFERTITPLAAPITDPATRQPVRLGIEASVVRVGEITQGSPAEKAGIRPGDIVVSADGQPLQTYGELTQHMQLNDGKPVVLELRRGDTILKQSVTPLTTPMLDPKTKEPIRLGISAGPDDRVLVRHVHMGAGKAFTESVGMVWSTISDTGHYLGRIFHGRESGDQLSGAIGMVKVSGDVARAAAAQPGPLWLKASNVGLSMAMLIAIISIGIGFLNLLPIPVLDGGHLLFYAYEAVARKPLGARVQEVGLQVGLALLVCLMLFAGWNDLNRLGVFKLLGGLFS